jgi:segregation and condensation protein B
MAFNLKLVLKALLFSSSQPLTVKEIQALFTRYHDQAQATLLPADPGEVIEGDAPPEAPAAEDEMVGASVSSGDPAGAAGVEPLERIERTSTPDEIDPLGLAAPDAELYVDVPSLVTAAEIREAMDSLAAELKAQNDIYLLIDGAQGYRLVTHPRFAKWIRIQRDEPPPVKLTQSALETMAVVAYRQPVTRSELEAIRGVSAEAGLAKLMERELVYIVGRADLPGRPLQYGTTDRFLEFVGVKSLVELPASDVLSPRQIDEWLNRGANMTPPADAEMGLPLEEGEGESPSLEAVEIEHIETPEEPRGLAAAGGEVQGAAAAQGVLLDAADTGPEPDPKAEPAA